MDEKTESRRDADTRAKRNPVAENTAENRIAFAAVFTESFAADSAALLSYVGLVRAANRATLLHAEASELCRAIGAQPTQFSRQIQSQDVVDDDVRESARLCAYEKAQACSALMFEAELTAGADTKVAAFARNAGEYARLLLYSLTHVEKSGAGSALERACCFQHDNLSASAPNGALFGIPGA